jgi:hypothetical protein
MFSEIPIKARGSCDTPTIPGQRANRDIGLDPMKALVNHIKTMIESDADPGVLMGVLAEAAIQTFALRIPAERRQETADAMMQLMAVRLRSKTVIRPSSLDYPFFGY